MQFAIRWDGPGSPVAAKLTMHFKGVERPKKIRTLTNTSMLNKLFIGYSHVFM